MGFTIELPIDLLKQPLESNILTAQAEWLNGGVQSSCWQYSKNKYDENSISQTNSWLCPLKLSTSEVTWSRLCKNIISTIFSVIDEILKNIASMLDHKERKLDDLSLKCLFNDKNLNFQPSYDTKINCSWKLAQKAIDLKHQSNELIFQTKIGCDFTGLSRCPEIPMQNPETTQTKSALVLSPGPVLSDVIYVTSTYLKVIPKIFIGPLCNTLKGMTCPSTFLSTFWASAPSCDTSRVYHIPLLWFFKLSLNKLSNNYVIICYYVMQTLRNEQPFLHCNEVYI